MKEFYTAKEVLYALDTISGGRVVKSIDDITKAKNHFVINKSSNIPGKSITEMPGLVYGSLDHKIKKIAIMMTCTECAIELAGTTGIDAILAHHPYADAASFGGVQMKVYLDLYNLCAFELHEAFHGRHPGLSYLHGHKPYKVNIKYGEIAGNIIYIGKALDEVKTIGDIEKRLNYMMDYEKEKNILMLERKERECNEIEETSVAAGIKIILGTRDSKVKNILHIFPHTGFTSEHLENIFKENPEIDTVLATISRVYSSSDLVKTAEKLNLNFVVGNSHAMEIIENGVPLAYALKALLPDIEIAIFRERYTSTPLNSFGSSVIREYGKKMALENLIK